MFGIRRVAWGEEERRKIEEAEARVPPVGARVKRSRQQNDEDLGLMRRVAADDAEAIGELYDRFGSLVYRMAYQAMPTRAEAEDAVQEVFVRLWRTADRFDPKRAALVTWVMLICRRHLVDKLRRNQARLKAGALDEGAAGEVMEGGVGVGLEQEERYREVLARVEGLPELQRTVVIRAYLGGQTLRQIGEELGVPIGTIKSALSRALSRLREETSGGGM